MEIAKNILEQLGGNRFVVMTGAKNLVGHEDGLSFKLPSSPHYTRDGINYVRITLNHLDLYDVEYGRMWGLKYRLITNTNSIYADMLQADFTDKTGLDCRLFGPVLV